MLMINSSKNLPISKQSINYRRNHRRILSVNQKTDYTKSMSIFPELNKNKKALRYEISRTLIS